MLILFYGFLGGVAALLLIAGLVFGWVPVPAAAQAEFWRLIIIGMIGLGTFINIEVRRRQTERLERKVDAAHQKVDQLDYTIKNGGGARIGTIAGETAAQIIKEQVLGPRDPNSRDRATDGGAA